MAIKNATLVKIEEGNGDFSKGENPFELWFYPKILIIIG